MKTIPCRRPKRCAVVVGAAASLRPLPRTRTHATGTQAAAPAATHRPVDLGIPAPVLQGYLVPGAAGQVDGLYVEAAGVAGMAACRVAGRALSWPINGWQPAPAGRLHPPRVCPPIPSALQAEVGAWVVA